MHHLFILNWLLLNIYGLLQVLYHWGYCVKLFWVFIVLLPHFWVVSAVVVRLILLLQCNILVIAWKNNLSRFARSFWPIQFYLSRLLLHLLLVFKILVLVKRFFKKALNSNKLEGHSHSRRELDNQSVDQSENNILHKAKFGEHSSLNHLPDLFKELVKQLLVLA